jgi:putative transposase
MLCLGCQRQRISAILASEENARQGRVSDMALLIKAIHAETRGAYGWPRIWRELRQRNVRVGKERDDAGQCHSGTLEAEIQSNNRQQSRLSDNLLNRDFQLERPDLVWTGDITYIATQEGWLYLAVVIDLFSRQVVGWAMAKRMTRHLVIDALTMAGFRRRPAEGLIFHSDQGRQQRFSGDLARLRHARINEPEGQLLG